MSCPLRRSIRAGQCAKKIALVGLWVSCLFFACLASASQTFHLANRDAAVVLEAGPASPQILDLAHSGCRTWRGPANVHFIDHIEVNSRRQPISWTLMRRSPVRMSIEHQQYSPEDQ